MLKCQQLQLLAFQHLLAELITSIGDLNPEINTAELSMKIFITSGPDIRKTCPCNVYPPEPHFYIAKLGYAGVYLFFLFLLQNIEDCGYSLEPPRRGGSNVYPQSTVGNGDGPSVGF